MYIFEVNLLTEGALMDELEILLLHFLVVFLRESAAMWITSVFKVKFRLMCEK